ncbi:hypothetical protein [Sphingomonas montana]|uniref:hypothetical protein n=1 Tax=Sphingomonas montana TaxID=1843236 RepID=UPI00096D557B|nr:hypothetical protein [Sphingomonas montana]
MSIFPLRELPRALQTCNRVATMARHDVEDFTVQEGVRSKDQCYINYGKGRSVSELTFKKLRHRALTDGAGLNKHDQAVVLITASISYGVPAGSSIIAIGKRLGLNPRHVALPWGRAREATGEV